MCVRAGTAEGPLTVTLFKEKAAKQSTGAMATIRVEKQHADSGAFGCNFPYASHIYMCMDGAQHTQEMVLTAVLPIFAGNYGAVRLRLLYASSVSDPALRPQDRMKLQEAAMQVTFTHAFHACNITVCKFQ